MSRRLLALASIAALALAGCAPAPAPPAGGAEETAAPAVPPAPSAQSATLPTPFTADQIRDEWIEGFTLDLRMSSPAGEELQRWTVLAADAEGVEIESANIDPAGEIVGEPQAQRSTWAELRDHALFDAASAARQEVTRSTALGDLDGWLYTVRDEAAGTVQELFFARSFPGAPVEMTVTRNGEVVTEMAQVRRHRPE